MLLTQPGSHSFITLSFSVSPAQERGGVDSEPAPQSRTQNLSRQINEVMDTLKGNINRLLQRHENLADLLNKTEEMKDGVSVSVDSYSPVK